MSDPEEPDPLIDEIHEIRKQISREYGHDIHRMVAHHIELQKQYADRLISEPPPPRLGERQSPADLEALLREVGEEDESDPPIDEIRAIRARISRENGDDVRRLSEYLIEYQKQFADRLISTPPNKDKPAA